MKLRTKRLILRPPQKSDWKDVLEACEDGSIATFTARIPHPYTEKMAKKFVDDSIKKWKQKKSYRFFIELKSEEKMIGVLELMDVDKFNEKAKTGSWMNPKYQRRGYMFEAKIAVNEFAFNRLKLNKLETGVFTFNKASKATQESVGYRYEGKKVETMKNLKSGKLCDEYLYGLLRRDWKRKLPKLKRKLEKKIRRSI